MVLYGKLMAHDAGMVHYGTGGAPIVGWAALEKIIEDQDAALSQTKITASDVSLRSRHNGSEPGNIAVGLQGRRGREVPGLAR